MAGLALLWWPYATQRNLDEWAVRLRQEGVPADAVVYDLVLKQGGNRSGPSETMHLSYDFAGRTRTAEVGCWDACEPPGTRVRIWVNPTDPADFVAEFGTLSGHRGRAQGVFGAAGFVLAVLSGVAAIGRLSRSRERHGGRKPVPASHYPADARLNRRPSRRRRRRGP